MNKLKGIMRERGVTQQMLADHIGITVQALNSKLNKRTVFTVPEAARICAFLEIDSPAEIFFGKSIPNTQQVKNEEE